MKIIKFQLLAVSLLIAATVSANTYVWTQKSNFSGGNRFAPFSFSIGSKGYVGCGITFSGSTYEYNYTDFWEYDAALNLWTQKATVPGNCRSSAAGFSIGSKGYVTTGWTPTAVTTTYEYDPASNLWVQKADFGGSARYSTTYFTIDSFAYVGMGYSPLTSDFWKYDPVNDAWTQIANIGGPMRQAASAFVLNGKAYVYGGTTALSSVVNELWSYDPDSNSWVSKSAMPGVGRYGASSFTMNGLGIVGLGNTLSTVLNDFYAYDPIADSWTAIPSMPTGARYAGFTFSFNNTGFVGAGASNNVPTANLNDDLWELSWAPANTITGKLYMDFNNNNNQDAGEVPLVNHLISETNTGRIAFSRADGSYELSVLDSGNFSVTTDSAGFFQPNPLVNASFFGGINLVDSFNDFAFQAANQFNDLLVSIVPLGAFRPGFNASYQITYSNIGTSTISNPILYFMPDTSVSYVSSSLVPSTVGTDTISWNLPALNPFQGGSILVTINVSAFTPIGTEIICPVVLEPTLNDINSYNNYDLWDVIVTGSFDPNDIAVNRELLLTNEFPNPPYLDYVIRFQNTGTDTAFTVDIINQLPIEVDVHSFELVSSSHPVVIRSIPEYNSLGFKFNNILLVDSNANEAMSHGFIHYRIKPVSTLLAGDQIPNSAGIYFDFNAPVLTNTAITTVVNPTAVKNVVKSTASVVAYPNPAKDQLNVLVNASTASEGKLFLTDIAGRKVIAKEVTFTLGKNRTELSTAKLSAGAYFLSVEYGNKKDVIKVLIK